MALLDKDEAVAVQHTVEEIANTYPQALIYAFMISSESYCFKDTAAGCKNKEFVERWICNWSSSSVCFFLQEWTDSFIFPTQTLFFSKHEKY